MAKALFKVAAGAAPPPLPAAKPHAPTAADRAAVRKANAIRAHDALNKPSLIGGVFRRAPGVAARIVKGTPHVVANAATYTAHHPSKVLAEDASILSAGIGNQEVQGSIRKAFAEGSPAPLAHVPHQIVRGYAGKSAANQPISWKGGLEIGAAFPLLRGPKALAELAKTIAAGENLAKAGRAGKEAYRTSTPIITGARKARAAWNKLSPRSRAIEQELHDSHERQQLFDAIDQIETPERAAAHKQIFDAAARKAAHGQGVPPAKYYAGLTTVLHSTQHVPEDALHDPGVLFKKVQDAHTAWENGGRDQAIQEIKQHIATGRATEGPNMLPHRLAVPKHLNSDEAIGKFADELHHMALEGEVSRHWYTESGKAILNSVGGDVERAKKLSALVALTSPQQKVYDNVRSAIQMGNLWKSLGDKEFAKRITQYEQAVAKAKAAGVKDLPKPSEFLPGVQGLVTGKQYKAALHILRGGNVNAKAAGLGMKTNSFFRNFMQEFDPEGFRQMYWDDPKIGPVTFDTWMRRAFGYDKGKSAKPDVTYQPGQEKSARVRKVLTDAQIEDLKNGKPVTIPAKPEEPISNHAYRFGEDTVTSIAKAHGWKPHEAQAAIWHSIKGRTEGEGFAGGGGFHVGTALSRLSRENDLKPLFRQGEGGDILGAYEPASRTIHYAQGSDTTTIQHEFFHDLIAQYRGTPQEKVFAKWAGAHIDDAGKVTWDAASHEKFVEGMLTALRTGIVLHGPLREAIRSVAENLDASDQPVPDEIKAGLNRILGTEPKSAAEQVREGTAGARSQYGKQKVLRREEQRKRAAKVEEIFRTVADPDEAHALAKTALRGEMPKIEYNGLKDFTPELVTELKGFIQHHQGLLGFQKLRLQDAIEAAQQGKVPTPSDMTLIEHVFGRKNALAMAGNAVVRGGWGDRAINALNIPRTLMATFDFSAVARQALVALASHPLITAKHIPEMIRFFKNPHAYEEAMQRVKNDPMYNLALAGKVSFTDLGHETALAAHEEAFGSDYAAQIPGIGHAVKGSGRAYVGFLNMVRMDLFKNQIRIAQAAGTNYHDEKFLEDIGKVINASTGRGTIGERAEHIMPALNTLLFSPRLMLSRINYMNPIWYVKLSPQARREALRGLFATAGAVSSTLYLASRIPGVDVGSLDPRSSDFGKLRIGNTRIDVAGGFQQYLRLASELATNTKISSTTGDKVSLGSGFGVPTRWDEVVNFGVNKLAPPGSMTVSALRGHDAVGNPINLPGQGEKTLGIPFGTFIPNNFVPLIIQDAKDLYREHGGGIDGIEWAMGGFGLGSFGVGLQTYGAQNPVPKLEKTLKKDAQTVGISTVLPTVVQNDIPWWRKAKDAGGLDENKSYLARLKIVAKLADEKTGGTAVQNAVAKNIKTEGQAQAAYSYVTTKMLYPALSSYQNALRSAAQKVKASQPATP